MKFCPVCNAQCEENALYCANCGCALNATPVTPAGQQPPTEPQAPAYNAPQQPQYQAPAYSAPQQPQYQAPAYNAPQQPQYQAPTYNAPQQPQYQAPAYNAPQQPQYQAPAYNVPQQSAEPQAPVYGNGNVPPVPPQNSYYQQPAAQPKKGGKGLMIGLIVGIIAIIAVIAVVAVVMLGGFGGDPNVGTEGESSIIAEGDGELILDNSEAETEEIPEESKLPTSPYDFDLEEENPFLVLENGEYQILVEDVFWANSGITASVIEPAMNEFGIRMEEVDGDVIFYIPQAAYEHYEEFFELVFDTVLETVIASGDYPALKDVDVNRTYTEVKLVIDRSEESYEDDATGASYYMATVGALHQMFHGVPSDLTMVTIYFVDADTADVYDSVEIVDSTEILE